MAMRTAAVIVPMHSVLMVVLFVGILLMRMVMLMRLLVLVRVVSMRIVMIGHIFTSGRWRPLHCSTAQTTLSAFYQRLNLACRNRMVRIGWIERAKYFIAQLVEG